MDKLTLIVAVIALLVSGFSLFRSGDSEVAFGGVTNYDAINLGGNTGIIPILGVGTTTPSTTIGEAQVDGSGTTTVAVMSSSATKGGCIQIENSVGTQTAVTIDGTTVVAKAGTCK